MEKGYVQEAYARRSRREMIEDGYEVSLLAYDSERGLYVFDVYGNIHEPK